MLRIAPSLLGSISCQLSFSVRSKKTCFYSHIGWWVYMYFGNTMVRFSRDVAYLWEFQNFKCPRASNRKTCAYYLLHVVIPSAFIRWWCCTWEELESIKKAKKNGVYFIDVKNTHECYMNFENVRISHTFVRYWYEIRDILVPILHARWRIGTNYSRCEIYEVWNLRFNTHCSIGLFPKSRTNRLNQRRKYQKLIKMTQAEMTRPKWPRTERT